MQYVGLTLSPPEGAFNAVDRAVTSCEAVAREAVLDVDWLSDGSLLAMYRLAGDREAVLAKLDDHPAVHEYSATDPDDDGFHLFVHCERGEPLSTLLGLVDEHALLLQRPIEFTDDGVFVTVAGESGALQTAFANLPGEVDADVLRTGEYVPEEAAVLGELTDRQREALEAAVEVGYYELPRAGTAEDVAEKLACTPSTASELLRRAESAIVISLLAH